MSLLPIFLKLADRPCLLVGAGHVAKDKIGSLLKTGLRLRVVAPEALPEIRAMAAEGQLEWVERRFELSDLDGHFVVIAATDSPQVNAEVYRGAVERNILCNSVDDIPNCDFFFGSVVSRGNLQIAISTTGESPAVAQRLRREIDEQLPEDIGDWLENLGQLRREVLGTHPRSESRKLLLHRLIERQVCASPSCPSREMALGPLDEEEEAIEAQEGEESGTPSTCPESDPHDERPAPFGPVGDFTPPAETVYLVGGGPGDPDLLTVKAVRLIQTADVILHDDLVTQAVLDLASPSAQIVNVGKRYGDKTVTQEEIVDSMIDHARAGRTVVRLKGGDPAIFGRAAEEIAALTLASVPFEMVPGITAAFAAAAALGCSLTERGSASSVHFSTAHRAESSKATAIPSLGDTTRAVYMPGRDLRPLAEEWLEEGLPPDLPCAVVSHAALPSQQIRWSTLAALGKAEPTRAPSLLIAGWALRQAVPAAPQPEESAPVPG
jgi:uroporphyrin-III C-methyltransferase/precorrin-2 dehydrogenase/sirohydrochlorin ferrochelatase